MTDWGKVSTWQRPHSGIVLHLYNQKPVLSSGLYYSASYLRAYRRHVVIGYWDAYEDNDIWAMARELSDLETIDEAIATSQHWESKSK